MPTTTINRLTPERCHRRVTDLNRKLSDRSPAKRSILSPPTIATTLKWSFLTTANHLSSFLQCTIAATQASLAPGVASRGRTTQWSSDEEWFRAWKLLQFLFPPTVPYA